MRIREETQRSSNPNSEASEALSTSPRNAIPLQPSSIANVAPAVSPATSPVPINRRARRSATATRPRSRKSKVRFLDEFPNASPPTPICAPVEEEFSDDDMELAHFLAELRAKRGKAMVSSLAAKAAKSMLHNYLIILVLTTYIILQKLTNVSQPRPGHQIQDVHLMLDHLTLVLAPSRPRLLSLSATQTR